MVTDWFTGREIATAMGIFVNSWPVGIALALLTLPTVAETVGLPTTMAIVTASVALGLALLLLGYRQPPAATGSTSSAREPLAGTALTGVVLAGAIWALYNAALGMIFGFGPAMLAERGWGAAAAGSTTSIVLWLVALSVPLGGLLADRLNRRDGVLALGLAAFAVLMLVAPASPHIVGLFIALGLVAGLAAGPIMSLPADVLRPGNRALGLGVFFSVYYLGIFIGPIIAGVLAERTGDAGIAFTLGGAMLIASMLLLALFRAMRGRIVDSALRSAP
jgi:MFS family permease